MENNSKFVRGKGKVRENIENDLQYRYKMEVDRGEYVLHIPYATKEALEKTAYDIIGQMSLEAHLKNALLR
ncbi:hypothetical protein ABE354_03180 [Brevibacillus laterosporus]|uniref:hypothetical protein n=1 Tax=Brevibacillus laterosporus TaxID=1465 RepID=UPI003D24A387